MASNTPGKNRGLILNLFIALSIVGLLGRGFITIGSMTLNVTYANPIPGWYPSFEKIVNLAAVALFAVAVIGIIKWKRWGLISLKTALALDFVLNLVTLLLVDSYNGGAKLAGTVFVAVFWFVALKDKLKNFS